jgi:murein DD-endopeptidase MepM/ murein hydrolase activator NlpD
MKRVNSPKNHLGGSRIYLLLAACLVVAGVVGYFTMLRGDAPTTPPVTKTEDPVTVEPVAPAITQTPTPVEPEPEPEQQETNAPATQRVINPLDGEVLAAFSMDELLYDTTMADWRTHNGVDIAASEGDSVRAAADGTISSVKNDPMTGVTVVIDHLNDIQTVYANLQENPPAAVGQEVAAGDVIGYVGTTSAAEASQDPHLHFSVLQGGQIIDPADFLG